MRDVEPRWITALQRLTGCETDTIRWNGLIGRWEFVLAGADGVPRSQFWGWFNKPIDPASGLFPFRDLDDDSVKEALANLEKTFVGNRHDGAGNTKREVKRRYDYNEGLKTKRYQEAGELFADMVYDRGHRLRGSPMIQVATTISGKKVERKAVAAG